MTTPTDLILSPIARTEVARPAAAPAGDPRVIDGEVTGSWFPRPMLPMLVSSGVLFALSVAALVQEALR